MWAISAWYEALRKTCISRQSDFPQISCSRTFLFICEVCAFIIRSLDEKDTTFSLFMQDTMSKIAGNGPPCRIAKT